MTCLTVIGVPNEMKGMTALDGRCLELVLKILHEIRNKDNERQYLCSLSTTSVKQLIGQQNCTGTTRTIIKLVTMNWVKIHNYYYRIYSIHFIT